jgi:hypothetical protein
MRDDVALSFDNMEGQPYLRRPASQMQQQQGRAVPSLSTSNNNGQGMALPFMTFDLPSNSGSNKPLPYGGGAYNGGGGGSYGGGGGGFASFEDEPPLLEGMCFDHPSYALTQLNGTFGREFVPFRFSSIICIQSSLVSSHL